MTELDIESILNPDNETRCGYVAIVGRPNVGKSTLLNHILGQKISITSRRPQTTRHQILGIKTQDDTQVVYVDTPGLHLTEHKAINRFMNKTASDSLKHVDVVVFVIDRTKWTDEDEMVLEKVRSTNAPVILAINKVDQSKEKSKLLPHIEELAKKHTFNAIIPVSAKHGHNLLELEKVIDKYLPDSVHFFPEDQITDRSQRFLAAELVREKIMRQLGEELPYAVTIQIDQFKHGAKVTNIDATIFVERNGQKVILIGAGGGKLKRIGSDARRDIEDLIDRKVMLRLWVKVKSGWSDDERALKSLGYTDY